MIKDLTEQWKNGELENGEYYVQTTLEVEKLEYIKEHNGFGYDETEWVEEVLAPVPSYEEIQELQEYKHIVTSYTMKPMDYDIACETVNKLLDEKRKLKEDCRVLKESLTNHKEIRNGLYSECEKLEQERQQLKRLLTECRTIIYENILGDYVIELCERITNAIGEKK